ncbi:beta-lactamase family protein [Streptosporangium roseum]|uniref:beta-lactamase family protein n=1 Tax=Streptosporangium roseum TaxID=2001 RepID=UPI0002E3523B|nr:beta-lactamase family protein [Streptosporangium roseum]
MGNRFRSYRPQELVRPALSKPAKFEPGPGWSYANPDYTPALLLIKKIAGRSLADGERSDMVRPGLEAFPASGPEPSTEGGEKSPGSVQRQP